LTTGDTQTAESADATPLRARVLLGEPLGLLDYTIPDSLVGTLTRGTPVLVPLGKRRTSAYVAELTRGPTPTGIALKEIAGVDLDRPALPPGLIDLLLFAADYYAVPPGEMLQAALPLSARPPATRYLLTAVGELATVAPELRDPDREILKLGQKHRRGFSVVAVERSLAITRRSALPRLKRLVERGYLTVRRHKGGPRELAAFIRTDADASRLSPRAKVATRLLGLIPRDTTIRAAELVAHERDAYKHLRTLEAAGFIRRVAETERKSLHAEPAVADTAPTPTGDQAAATAAILDAVLADRFQAFLLQGVTGSGKTEVYLRVIAQALARGKTALVLVPEIALTPQLSQRFRARFGEKCATFHSGLTPAERRDEWERVSTGEAVIGLGARSALFLPLKNLGVVIVDEEHETSFKQDETPRYHARDLAVVRAQRDRAVVVLGSATPSLESSANATQGRYTRLLLPRRVMERPMPAVEVVDLARSEKVGDDIFTRALAVVLERTIKAGEQAVLFLNRRGFSPYIYCRDCGHAFHCPDCAVTLTLHRRRGLLLCHYCGFTEPAPDICPKCVSHRLVGSGLGTERVESEIQALLGDVKTLRLDRDSVHNRADLERVLDRFARREAQVLIGTQMVAKGHDFPAVTMVGVVAADASLNFPDFRAAERTFQLLAQVAGRAGRGAIEGRVVVQAYETEHYAIRLASQHDFDGFVERELQSRRELGYPPFSHLALVRIESSSEARALAAAGEVADRLRAQVESSRLAAKILGPAPAPLSRLKGLWRVQVLVKAFKRQALRPLFVTLLKTAPRDVRQILDVDPLSML
jgi:primosomal protein N' (replication factor Y) (superfamily II helicase)